MSLSQSAFSTQPASEHQTPWAIEFHDVHKIFDNNEHVLKGINLQVPWGETISLVGNSGTGKSILVKMLIGLLQPSKGTIVVAGQDVKGLSEMGWMPLRKRVSMVFQANALFDSMTVYENIAFPLRQHLQMPEPEIKERVAEVLEWVLLPGIEQQYPQELSGGMRKRVGVARGIVTEPEILLYDEPTAGLDPVSTTVVDEMIRRFQRERGVTSIVITHDLKSAMNVGDRVALLNQGVVWACGTPDQLMNEEDTFVRGFFEGYRLAMELLQ